MIILSLSGTVSAAVSDSDSGSQLDRDKIEAMAVLKSKAAELCGKSDSDIDKVRKLNKYVCDKADYDKTNENGGLTAFVNGNKVICTGYAESLAYLLDCVNVKNFTVTDYVSTGENSVLHVWNVVYIDGKWLHVDPTWNDATRDKNNPDGRYFLLTSDKISRERNTMSLKTEEDYNNFYEFIKTITLSLKTADQKSCIVQNGRTMVPLYQTMLALGGYVSQNEDGGLTVILDARKLNLTIGSKTGLMDGKEFCMDAAPQIINGTAMVPARMVFEKLGAAVDYNAISSVVTIAYDPYQAK